MIKTLFTISAIALILSSCSNKMEEVAICLKKSANTLMISGKKPTSFDVVNMCSQYEGALKDAHIDVKRKYKELTDTIEAHIEAKILFKDVEDAAFTPLPCGEEFIKNMNKVKNADEKNYFLKNRSIECSIAVEKIDKMSDGKFYIRGVFFNDEYVFDYSINSLSVNVIIDKDETQNVLPSVKKEDVYADIKGDWDNYRKMILDGPSAYKQILKFKGDDVYTKSAFGFTVYCVHATEYTFVKPDPKINKQQHFGYNDFLFGDQSTNNTPIIAGNNEEKSGQMNVQNEPPTEYNPPITGIYSGAFGKDVLTIKIESISNGVVVGWDEVKGNKRTLSGTINNNLLILKEPGDDKWDGLFEINYENETLKGVWKSNNGKSTKNFVLTKK